MPTMANDTVADSTDWLATPLGCLTAVESALRCQVCKDFYETPMITSCSHTFCSLCIRRALSNDGKCPLCRAGDQELRLRSNWAMEEAVESFKKARPMVLDLARNRERSRSSPKRSFREVDGRGEATGPSPKKLRTSTRLSRTRGQAPAPAVIESEEDVEAETESEGEEEFVPEPDDGLVACPSCQKRMKEYQVFTHLEKCPGPTTTNLGTTQRQQNDKTAERLPALSYAMFKEGALRKKMQDLGISSQGPRHLLEKRHKEWITIWNANCDAARPKKRFQLLQDLDVWEKTQGGRAPQTGKAAMSAALIKDKDFDGSAWAAQHDSSFKDLIANARKSRMEAKKKTEENSSQPPTNQGVSNEGHATTLQAQQPGMISLPQHHSVEYHPSVVVHSNSIQGVEAPYNSHTSIPPQDVHNPSQPYTNPL